MKEFLEVIVRGLVDHPEDVEIEEERRGRRIVYNVRLREDDRGHVIGRGGSTATALRTLANAVAGRQRQEVQIEILD